MRPFAIVSSAEKMHDDGLPTMSADTSGSSLYSSTPRYLASFGSLRERGVDRRRLSPSVFSIGDEVGDRTGRASGTRSDDAVELALELGQHEADRLRRAGACSG